MWLLSSDGPWLGNARLWLRPGERHLFGRTTSSAAAGQKNHHINEKSVSRQHLLIEVSPVRQGASLRTSIRSEVQLIDNSKVGTTLNGVAFTKTTQVVDQIGADFNIQLGKNGPTFKLQWHVVTLSLTNLPKGTKQKNSIIQPLQEKLEQADIKILTEYDTTCTTHVVAKKRNNPAVLQALNQANRVVTFDFADALFHATQKRGVDANEDVIPSLLETDFDRHWPDENDFIVPAGEEPVPRPKELLKPNPARMEIFKGFIFFFFSEKQIDLLRPVITTGGGKAFHCKFEANVTALSDVVDYIRDVSGYTGKSMQFDPQSQRSAGPVLVRWVDESAEYLAFERAIQLEFDQRSIEQNELLDVILTLDTSGLRRALDEEFRGASDPTSSDALAPSVEPSQTLAAHSNTEASKEETQPNESTRPRERRIVTQSRFKGFADIDPSQYTKPEPHSPESSPDANDPETSSNQVSGKENVDAAGVASSDTKHGSLLRKRKTADEEDVEMEEARLEEMLAGPQRFKRQRTEAAENGHTEDSCSSSDRQAAHPNKSLTTNSKRKPPREIDYDAEMLKRREKADKDREEEEESMRQAMKDIDSLNLKNLAKVEVMDMPTRSTRPKRHDADSRNIDNDRWDVKWNGRRNFKKFQRQGERRDRPRLQRVMIPLEEVSRKGQGISEVHWRASNNQSLSRGGQSASHLTQSNSTQRSGANSAHRSIGNDGDDDDDDDDGEEVFHRRLQISRDEDAYDNDIAGLVQGQVRGSARSGGHTSMEYADTDHPSMRSGLSRASAIKRSAGEQGGTASKRMKQSRLPPRESIPLDDDDDEDEMTFRRRR